MSLVGRLERAEREIRGEMEAIAETILRSRDLSIEGYKLLQGNYAGLDRAHQILVDAVKSEGQDED